MKIKFIRIFKIDPTQASSKPRKFVMLTLLLLFSVESRHFCCLAAMETHRLAEIQVCKLFCQSNDRTDRRLSTEFSSSEDELILNLESGLRQTWLADKAEKFLVQYQGSERSGLPGLPIGPILIIQTHLFIISDIEPSFILKVPKIDCELPFQWIEHF